MPLSDSVKSSSLATLSYSAWISPYMQEYAAPHVNASRFGRAEDLRGKASDTWSVSNIDSQLGSIDANGDGVDTEFDFSESSDLSNTGFTTSEVTVAVNDYGIMRTIHDNAEENIGGQIDGLSLLDKVAQDNARILQVAHEDDFVGNFASFTNEAATSSGTTLGLTDLDEAITTLRDSGTRAPGGVVCVLDKKQASDVESDITSTNSSQAAYPGTADRYMGVQRDSANGLIDGHFADYKGVPLYSSDLTDTTDGGTNVAGALFVRGDVEQNKPYAAIGTPFKRAFRVRFQRDESLGGGATEVVCTMRRGAGILQDMSGVAIISGA